MRHALARHLRGVAQNWNMLCLKRQQDGLRMNDKSSLALMASAYFSQQTPRINASYSAINGASTFISTKSRETWHGY
jgi:hypothetical protein